MNHIGFTGTRNGLTPAQSESLRVVLVGMKWRPALHHGCCKGADAQAHEMADERLAYLIGHPSNIKSMTADCRCDDMHPPKPPLERNRDIVDASSLLIACPAGMAEEVRSGTWATVRMARKKGIPIVIVWPNGTVTREGPK